MVAPVPVNGASRTEDKASTTLEAQFGISISGFSLDHFGATYGAMLYTELATIALAVNYFYVKV